MIGLGPPFNISGAGLFRSFVAGLHDSAGTVQSRGIAEGVHVFLRPAGVRAVLNVSAGALSGCVVHLADLIGDVSDELHDRLKATQSWSNRFDILDQLFTRLLRGCTVSPQLSWAWQKLVVEVGQIRVHELAKEIGWGRRHLTERFGAEFGVTPKTLGRIARFEYACALIRRHRGRLVDIAQSAGYHDQAHMTREWIALANCTPKTWISEELPFVQDYELAGMDNSI
jgi:AraC-like DNA-binding protein